MEPPTNRSLEHVLCKGRANISCHFLLVYFLISCPYIMWCSQGKGVKIFAIFRRLLGGGVLGLVEELLQGRSMEIYGRSERKNA